MTRTHMQGHRTTLRPFTLPPRPPEPPKETAPQERKEAA